MGAVTVEAGTRQRAKILDVSICIQAGQQKQDSLNPQKYRYVKAFDDLASDNTHIIAIVLCRFSEGDKGKPIPNNYIVTAYQKEIR
jgi:hypothetical protein